MSNEKTKKNTTPDKTEKNPPSSLPDASLVLGPDQRRLAGLVAAAGDDAPMVENIDELFSKDPLKIPKGVPRPENAYKWVDVKKLEQQLHYNGGIYEIVTRSNHSHVPSGMFGLNGGIMLGMGNILCFTRQKYVDIKNEMIARRFDLKFKKSTEEEKKYHTPDGKEAVVVYPTSENPPMATRGFRNSSINLRAISLANFRTAMRFWSRYRRFSLSRSASWASLSWVMSSEIFT